MWNFLSVGPHSAASMLREVMFILALLVFLMAISVAQAADGSVTVPWGDWTAEALGLAAVLVAGWIGRAIPSAVRQWAAKLLGDRVDQLLERAIQYGINAVAGAVRGKTLSLDTGLDVANEALDYAVKHAPKLVQELGVGEVREKILARLDLDEWAAIGATSR